MKAERELLQRHVMRHGAEGMWFTVELVHKTTVSPPRPELGVLKQHTLLHEGF